MQIELNEVDLGFVVSLAVLREVLASLNINARRWWIASDPADAVRNGWLTIGHGDPGCRDRLNTLYYRLPVLNDDVPGGSTDRLVVLVESSVVSPEQPGLYWEKGRVVQDEIEDIQSFLFPILHALAARFKRQ
jgi:hypothetical protein